ncbi:uncharacterized protein LOC135119158 [Helicoverpa armigera]|uniref:uncharacterized protein LOC135119158 n=1 Tax=Helicoverpa armigera TaxID=29058 RepID=UPI0030831686
MGKSETSTQRKRRLEKNKLKRQQKLANESDEEKRQRLSKRRKQDKNKILTQRQLKLDKAKERMQRLRASETKKEHDARIAKNRQHTYEVRATESVEQREIRLRSLREYDSRIRANETPYQREDRLSALREHSAQVRACETPDQREDRLSALREHSAQVRACETPDQREDRLSALREHSAQVRACETPDQREDRLSALREHSAQVRACETPDQREDRLSALPPVRACETPDQREDRLSALREHSAARACETPDQREDRLSALREYSAQVRACETPDQREDRLSALREHSAQVRACETPYQREVRLTALREHSSQVRTSEKAQIETFNKTINIFCDRVCEICTKRCYPNQVTNCNVNVSASSYLPAELTNKGTILLCHRCKNHLTSKKKTCGPAKAYWNNLDPGEVPDIIKQLTQPEQRLLSRIIPFVKIVKYDGLFGQYGFRGQAVLFAQDIFEVTETLPNILPRSTDGIGMVVITEHLENLNVSREYNISRSRVYEALRWLINNNPLYHDVIIDNSAQILQEDLLRVTQHNCDENAQNNQELLEPVSDMAETTNANNAYTMITDSMRILRASWNQDNKQVFNANYTGRQCFAMVLANITRAAILMPHLWTNNILNTNMLEGDALYAKIKQLSVDNPLVPSIDATGYLEIRHFRVIKESFMMFGRFFKIEFDEETDLVGCLRDSVNRSQDFGLTLKEALATMFTSHKAGVLIASSKSLGVMYYNNYSTTTL